MTAGTDVASPAGSRAGGPPPPAPSGHRRRNIVILVVIALVLIPLLVVGGWLWYQFDPPGGGDGAEVTMDVQQGWGVSQIADALEAKGVVDSATGFRLYARIFGAGPFQAGRHVLSEGMGASGAASVLEQPPVQKYRELALIPGLTLDMIADEVGKIPGLNRDRFLEVAASGVVRSKFQPSGVTSLEGLTWPDTYYVSEGEDEEKVLLTLVEHFDEQATEVGLAGSPDSYRSLIIASLIQTEAKLDEDRPQIAAVVENRLRDDMPLQIDATLLYARGSRAGVITDEDYDRDSPYNTYRNRGLPPTPISTVTRTSIEAALNPADVPYKFYVLIDEDGRHKFATTYAEHQKNVAEANRKGLLGN